MTSLRIERLRMDAFRGITGSLELDLRAPLTVVYASNGTGKTTLCDAAEWLVTAAVERLSVQDASNVGYLRSTFSDDPPRVEADIVVDGSAQYIKRQPEGASIGPARDGRTETIKPSDLLALLAPEGAGSGRGARNATTLRRQWLRGARFLSVEALSALLDTDDETVDRRRQVFSDLLGVRLQADAKDRISRYLEALKPGAASLRRQVEKAEAAVESARADVVGDSDDSAGVRELAAAEATLGISAQEDRQGSVVAEIVRRRQGLSVKAEALEVVKADWKHRNTLRRELVREETAERDASTAAAAAAEAKVAAEARVRDADEKLRLSGLRSRRLDELGANLSRQLATFASECGVLAPALGLTAPPTIRAVREALPQARLPTATRVALTREVQGLVDRSPDIVSFRRRRNAAEAALAAVREAAATPEVRQSLADAVSSAEGVLAVALERRDRDAGPVQRLRVAGEAFLHHDHGATECPTCGHDWRSHEDLSEAIKALLERTPGFLAAAEEGVANATAAVVEARRTLAEAMHASEEAARLVVESTRLSEGVSRFELAAQGAGIALEPAETFASRLQRELACLRLAGILLETDGLREAPAAEFGLFVDEDVSLVEARSRIDQAGAALAVELRTEREALTNAVTAARDGVSALVRADAERTSEIEKARGRQASLRSRIDAFASAWTRVAGQRSPSDAVRAEVEAELAVEASTLDRAEGHRAAADAATLRTTLGEGLRAAEADLAASRLRLATVIRNQETAERACRAFDDHYREASRRQVEALRDVVNPLFARMHANRIYDSIGFGDGEDLLRWHADVGGRSFDPKRNFSQGQRQDLALALFVARARSLGGTFFLDEPVIHLDDVNRVGLLDVLRAAAISGSESVNFVVTTSSRSMTRHMIEKFDRVEGRATDGGPVPALRVYELLGNGRDGVEKIELYPRPA
jgi:exonuclease SbcC